VSVRAAGKVVNGSTCLALSGRESVLTYDNKDVHTDVIVRLPDPSRCDEKSFAFSSLYAQHVSTITIYGILRFCGTDLNSIVVPNNHGFVYIQSNGLWWDVLDVGDGIEMV
jgi:hypothetical protein